MRRALALGALALALLTPACADADQRPEGVVERWLTSLNQGAAGRPDRYASDEVSQAVLPGWHDLEPGELDVIEVGTDRGTRMCEERCADVPFRVTDLNGDVTEGVALTESISGDGWHVTAVELGTSSLPPDGGSWAIPRAAAGWWLGAGAIAAVLSALAIVAVRLVRRSTRDAA